MRKYDRLVWVIFAGKDVLVLISFVKGTVEEVTDVSAILSCGGIGYEVLTTTSAIAQLSVQAGQEAKLFTAMQVREDGISLVGFPTKAELETFGILCSVSGVGAKAALSLLSTLSPQALMLSIVADDVNALCKAQGIGKKIAQRLALELKDKFKTVGAAVETAIGAQQSITAGQAGGAKQDALDALVALGYGRSEAVRVVMEVALEGMGTEQILKLSLKKLAAR